MKKIVAFVLTVFMVLGTILVPTRVEADENTSLLSYYNVDSTSNSITVTWRTSKSYSYSTVYFKLASDSSSTSGITVYPSSGTYTFTKTGLKSGTDYLICIANTVPQHMLHRTVTTKPCQHLNHNNDTYVRTRYVNTGSSTTHSRIDIYKHSCTDCGYNLGEIEASPVNENHTLNGNTCTKCGYTKTCSHSSYTDTYLRTYNKSLNSSSHQVIDVYSRNCKLCGAKFKEVEIVKTTKSHSFTANGLSKHKCNDCGYVESHIGDIGTCSKCGIAIYKPLKNGVSILGWAKVYGYDALQLAKEGRLYVTDSNGQIYKKVVNSIGQTDDIFIPVSSIVYDKDSVYIGNYSDYSLNKNTSSKNIFTSLIPEKILEYEKKINNLKLASVGVSNSNLSSSTKSAAIKDIQKIIDGYELAKKGQYNSDFNNYEKGSFYAKYGDKNINVENIQKMLYNIGYTSQQITGYYGYITFNNIAYLQLTSLTKYPTLKVTGYVDNQTLKILNDLNASVNNTTTSFSDDDDIYTPIDFKLAENDNWIATNILFKALEKKGIDINLFANEYANTLVYNLGLENITRRDFDYLTFGILMSADDNLLFGASKQIIKWGFNKELPEDNYYYMLGKVWTDKVFLASFISVTTGATCEALKSLSESGTLAMAGLYLAPSGAGGVVIEGAAAAQLTKATAFACAAALSTAGSVRSGYVYNEDAQKLKRLPSPALKLANPLRENMKRAGIKPPPYKHAAHHIVPANAKEAEEARKILYQCGIDINDASNGVFLPVEYGNKYAGNATVHRGRHTWNYINEVTNRLRNARLSKGDTEKAKRILQLIKDDLLSGKLKL